MQAPVAAAIGAGATVSVIGNALRGRDGDAIASLGCMSFKRISCATDFSACSEVALRIASTMARQADAELEILHAWHVPAATQGELMLQVDSLQALADDAQRRLDDAIHTAMAAGVTRVRGKLLNGTPWVEIVGELERSASDLCVIGTQGRTGLARVLLGSVAATVIRHAPCSVLAVRGDSRGEAFVDVLVPTDFSESATFAADLAAELAVGTLTLLHVTEVPVAHTGEVALEELATMLDARAAAALDELATRVGSATRASVRRRARVGYPGMQLLAALDEDRAVDLVVMGSEGRTGIKRLLLGSVAEKVVRHARCTVLVARPRSR